METVSDEIGADDGLTGSRISRRTVIKAGSIVAGSVWVAPVIELHEPGRRRQYAAAAAADRLHLAGLVP